MLTKEEILNVEDLPTREISISEWKNGVIRMKSLSGKDRDEFETAVQQHSKGNSIDLRGLKVLLLSLTIVDEKNELMFTKEDLEALNSKSAKILNHLFEVAQEMNGIGEEAVEELRKNSLGGQSVASGSNSPVS